MKMLPFKPSSLVSIGTELELQIIDPLTYDLIALAKDLIRHIKESRFNKLIKPEVTQSMIEINSSIHHSPRELNEELIQIRDFLALQGKHIGAKFSGGGTHPFQKWTLRKIFPSQRFKNLSRRFRYLSKRSTVFGQHVHVGCVSADDALYLTHALARYVPQLIALSASSPFYQGIDTGYQTTRTTVFNAFPLSGVIPYLTTWKEFSAYYYKMRKLGIIQSMKDFYWDIRPKPEFGTVEVRVCDMPLTIQKATLITAYIQTLAHFLMTEKQFTLSPELYYFYSYNRFQASRYGFEGHVINPETNEHCTIAEDILQTLKTIDKSARLLKTKSYLKTILQQVNKNSSDANFLRDAYKKNPSLPKVVQLQCSIFSSHRKTGK